MRLPPSVRVATLVALLLTPTVARAQAPSGDYLASPNVEFIRAIKPPAGLTAGARIVGHFLYVTSGKELTIYDITKPEDPQQVGTITVDIQFENEEVPTNGKILGISSDTYHSGLQCLLSPPAGTPVLGSCLRLFDVRDPANVKELPSVPNAGDHTSTCVLDCQYFYGSSGTITDARGALEGTPAKIIGNWQDAVKAQGVTFRGSCHHVRELRPGVLLTACQPFELLSVNPEDGGSILKPKILAVGGNQDGRFIHSARWPREGQDKFALLGGETNFKPQCGPTNGAFMTFDASHATRDGRLSGPLDEIRPVNGTYLDSNPPAQILGCSVHWFEEHPSFRDGGLVALAEYENGTRFLQITPQGKIKEQGYFIPLGGAASAPHWAPNSDIVYSIDYERGIDVLRYKGSHYVPDAGGGVMAEPGAVPGTEGAQPTAATRPDATSSRNDSTVCATAAGFDSALARPHGRRDDEAGRGPGLRFTVARRQRRSFTVDVFRVSQGRRVLRERLVKRFTGRTRSFSWDGHSGKVGDGLYFVRFSMRLANRQHDLRRVTLVRRNGVFASRPPFYLRDDCGALESFKLSGPAFGGVKRTRLGIAYRLTTGADAVSVDILAGKRVIRHVAAAPTDPRTTHRLRVGPAGIRSGTDVRVRITVRRANARVTSTLWSRRL